MKKMKVKGEGPGLMREIGLIQILANSWSVHLKRLIVVVVRV